MSRRIWAIIAADLPDGREGFAPTNYPQLVTLSEDTIIGSGVYSPFGCLDMYWEAARSAFVAPAPDPTPAQRAVFVALNATYGGGSIRADAQEHLAALAAARAEVAKLGSAVAAWAPQWVPSLDAKEAEVRAATATTPLSRLEDALARAKTRPSVDTLVALRETLRTEEVGILAEVFSKDPAEARSMDSWRRNKGCQIDPHTAAGIVWVSADKESAKLDILFDALRAAYLAENAGGLDLAAVVAGLDVSPMCPELLRARTKIQAKQEEDRIWHEREAKAEATRAAARAAEAKKQQREAAIAAEASRQAGMRREARLVAFKAAVAAKDWAALRALGPEPIRYYIAWDQEARAQKDAEYNEKEAQRAEYERREPRYAKYDPGPHASYLRWWKKDPNAAEFLVACKRSGEVPQEAVDAYWAYLRQEPLDDMAEEAGRIQERLAVINRALGRK